MPKSVMVELRLDVTKLFCDLYFFDFRRVKFIGLIKYLSVSLTQIPNTILVMDIVVINITASYGMFLSRSWARKLGGTLQMDLSYTNIPLFKGEE